MRLSTLAIALFACYTTTHAADVKQSLDTLHANLSAVSGQITNLSEKLTELVGKIQSPASKPKFHKSPAETSFIPSPPPPQLDGLDKFQKMKKQGIPDQAIYNKMQQDNCTDAQIRNVLGDEFVDNQASPAPKTAVIKPSTPHAGGGGMAALFDAIKENPKLGDDTLSTQPAPPAKVDRFAPYRAMFEQGTSNGKLSDGDMRKLKTRITNAMNKNGIAMGDITPFIRGLTTASTTISTPINEHSDSDDATSRASESPTPDFWNDETYATYRDQYIDEMQTIQKLQVSARSSAKTTLQQNIIQQMTNAGIDSSIAGSFFVAMANPPKESASPQVQLPTDYKTNPLYEGLRTTITGKNFADAKSILIQHFTDQGLSQSDANTRATAFWQAVKPVEPGSAAKPPAKKPTQPKKPVEEHNATDTDRFANYRDFAGPEIALKANMKQDGFTEAEIADFIATRKKPAAGGGLGGLFGGAKKQNPLGGMTKKPSNPVASEEGLPPAQSPAVDPEGLAALREQKTRLEAEFNTLIALSRPNAQAVIPTLTAEDYAVLGSQVTKSYVDALQAGLDASYLTFHVDPSANIFYTPLDEEDPAFATTQFELFTQPDKYNPSGPRGSKNISEFTDEDIPYFRYYASGGTRSNSQTWIALEQIYMNVSITSPQEYSPVYNLNSSSQWLKIGSLINKIRWGINQNQSLKRLIIQRIFPEFEWPYDMQALNTMLLQDGYHEPSFIRLVTAAILSYSTDRFAPQGNANLYYILSLIKETHNNVITKILEECSLYTAARVDKQQSYVQFDVLVPTATGGFTIGTAVKLGVEAHYTSRGRYNALILLKAIALRRHLDGVNQAIFEAVDATEQQALQLEQQRQNSRQRARLLQYTNAAAAAQEAAELKTVEASLEQALLNFQFNDSKARQWNYTYVSGQIKPWAEVATSSNMLNSFGGAWNFSKVIWTVYDMPSLINDTEEIEGKTARTLAQETLDTVITKIFQSQLTLQSFITNSKPDGLLQLYMLVKVAATKTDFNIPSHTPKIIQDCIAKRRGELEGKIQYDNTNEQITTLVAFLNGDITMQELTTHFPPKPGKIRTK